MQNNFQIPVSEITTVAKGAGIIFIGTIIGNGLRYLFEVSVARSIGPALFGLFFLGLAVLKISEIISTVGIPSGVLRYVAIFNGEGDKERIKGIIILAIGVALIAGIIAAILLIVTSKIVAVGVLKKSGLMNVLRLLALGIPFSALTTVLISSTQGFQIMKYKVYVRDLFEPTTRLLIVMVVFIFGWKLYGVIFAYLISIALGSALTSYCLNRVFPTIARKYIKPIFEWRKLFTFSWPLFFANSLFVILLWTDTLMIGFFKTSHDVGIYAAAQRTALLGTVVLASFATIFRPMISDLHNRKEHKKLESLFKIVTKWTFTFSFPIFVLIVFFVKPILSIFGQNFTMGANCLVILSIAQLVRSGTGPSGQMISMIGRSKTVLANAATVFLVNVVLNLILIPKYGILGAATATAFSIILVNVMKLLEICFILGIHPYRIDFLKPLIAGAGGLFGLYITTNYFIPIYYSPLFFSATGSLFFIGIYVLFLFLLKIGKEDIIVLDRIKARLSFKSS
ncbi:MAG: flippase [Candidatus Bathyarchaeota archaeon]|nr:flippase [Candidatus Bathyarchaeota archaeon]